MARKTRTVVLLGDFHSGSQFGLTPPTHMGQKPDPEDAINKTERRRLADRLAVYNARYQLFKFYEHTIREIYEQCGRPYLLYGNGDLIDGKGDKNGGIEQLTTDRVEQCDMAVHLLKMWDAEAIRLSYGTGYHVGKKENWESTIATRVDAPIAFHDQFSVNGTVFDVRHHMNKANLLHTRVTPLGREVVANIEWYLEGMRERADIVVRSHVHHYQYAETSSWAAMSLPALQLPETGYGLGRCTGLVQVGIVVLQIKPSGGFDRPWLFQPELRHHAKAVDAL